MNTNEIQIMYKAKGNEIVDQTGKQIAIILCTNCTKRDGRMMAAFAAQQMNIELRNKEKLKNARRPY